MKIVIDENIPLAEFLFSPLGDVQLLPGRTLSADQVSDADALLVRSVTQVNQALLENSRVKFVGSATIGTDHIDLDWLQKNNITFSAAPGCNANSVAEYVLVALLEAANKNAFNLDEKKLAIVGFGNVGQAVAKKMSAFVASVSVCDPPLLATANPPVGNYVDLAEVTKADIVCCHTPLVKRGEHATYHLIDEDFISSLKPGCVLLNAGRGGVIDEMALLRRIRNRGDLTVILDVWDGEPDVNRELLNEVFIGTPHIAGYSVQGKTTGSWMVYAAFCECFGIEMISEELFVQETVSKEQLVAGATLLETVRKVYDIWRDDKALRNSHSVGDFDGLRKNYPGRKEFSAYQVEGSQLDIFG